MPMSKDDKLNFAFRVAVELAERNNLLPPAELWMAKWDLSPDEIKRSSKNVLNAAAKLKGQKPDYPWLEHVVKDGRRYTAETAQVIIAILYMMGDISEIVDGFDYIPNELVSLIQTGRKWYEPKRPQ